MRLVYSAIAAAVILVGCTVGLTLAVHNSLWFLWKLLPQDADIRAVIGRNNAGVHRLLENFGTHIPAEYAPYAPLARTIAVATEDTDQLLIILPRQPLSPAARRPLKQKLENDGWQVNKLGLFIVAHKGRSPSLSSDRRLIRDAVLTVARHQFIQHETNQAVLIAAWRAGKLPLLHEAGTVVAFAPRTRAEIPGNKHNILDIRLSANEYERGEFIPVAELPDTERELFVAFPSHIFKELSQQAQEEWNNMLTARLGFVHTKPPLLTQLPEQRLVMLGNRENETVVALAPPADALAARIKDWIKEEEAFSRPQKKYFKLPDGTLGAEYVPGELQETANTADTEGCQDIEWQAGKAMHLWICEGKNATVISTNQDMAHNALNKGPNNRWFAIISREWLDKAEFLKGTFNAIGLTGNNNYTHIRLRFAD